MGPDNSSPVRLFFIDPETGEQKELTQSMVKFSFTEARNNEIMTGTCMCCGHADCNRTKDGKIRCKRWSQWVDPTERGCREHMFSISVNMLSSGFLPQEKKGT